MEWGKWFTNTSSANCIASCAAKGQGEETS